MRKVLITIIVLITLLCSGGHAQSPNSFSVALEKKISDWVTVPCEESGFCVVAEKKLKENKQLIINHFDTAMHTVFDTAFTLGLDSQGQFIFYENGALVVFHRVYNKRQAGRGTLLLYHLDSKTIDSLEITGLPADGGSGWWHHYNGNIVFSDKGKRGDQVWFLPAGATQPLPFSFTQTNHGEVVALNVDTTSGKAIICFSSAGRTAYFETDFTGKSSFANILNEPATSAQWISVSRNHSLLMLYYEDDKTFYLHPINILNHKVMPSETIYCADILVPETLPNNATKKQTIMITPNSYISFLPSYISLNDDRISCITELYWPEYYNYFNGMYVENRFYGYRYERGDVHFFDTNGVFQTNITFPYGNEGVIQQNIHYKLRIRPLQNNDLLLYYRDGQVLTTMLLDSTLKVKDPMRIADLPVPQIPLKKHKIVVDKFAPWYRNKFLLTNFRINTLSREKTAFDATRLEYR